MLLVQGDEAESKLRKDFGEGEGSLREELRSDIDQKDDDNHDDDGDHILMIIIMRVTLMMMRRAQFNITYCHHS